jgi:hypothetical protein
MAMTPAVLEICVCAFGTGEPDCVGRPARPFFMLEAHGPQRTVGHVAALEPTSAWRRDPELENTR